MPAAASLQLVADVRFEVRVDGRRRARPTRVTGWARADGTTIFVDLSATPALLGTGTGPARRLAATLADQGLALQVSGPAGRIVTLGTGVVAPWWQRVATRSRHIRIGTLSVVLGSIGGPALFELARPALPGSARARRAEPLRTLARTLTHRR